MKMYKKEENIFKAENWVWEKQNKGQQGGCY